MRNFCFIPEVLFYKNLYQPPPLAPPPPPKLFVFTPNLCVSCSDFIVVGRFFATVL